MCRSLTSNMFSYALALTQVRLRNSPLRSATSGCIAMMSEAILWAWHDGSRIQVFGGRAVIRAGSWVRIGTRGCREKGVSSLLGAASTVVEHSPSFMSARRSRRNRPDHQQLGRSSCVCSILPWKREVLTLARTEPSAPPFVLVTVFQAALWPPQDSGRQATTGARCL